MSIFENFRHTLHDSALVQDNQKALLNPVKQWPFFFSGHIIMIAMKGCFNEYTGAG